MNPPSVGPMTEDSPNAAPMKPEYLPLSSGGNRSRDCREAVGHYHPATYPLESPEDN